MKKKINMKMKMNIKMKMDSFTCQIGFVPM